MTTQPTLTQKTTIVADYINIDRYNSFLNMKNGFFTTITDVNIQSESVNEPIFVTHTKANSFERPTFNSIISSIESKIQGFRDTESTISTHESMFNYMSAIMNAICLWRYNEMKTKVLEKQNNSEAIKAEFRPLLTTLTMTGEGLVEEISVICTEVLKQFVNKSAVNDFLVDKFAEGGEQLSRNTNTLRYKLRNEIVRKLKLKNNFNMDEITLNTFKHFVSDLFIISHYPYIHYMYITTLLDNYKKQGNFVDMRNTVFARVSFVMNTLIMLHEKAIPVLDKSGDYNKHINTISNIVNVLYRYIVKLTDVQFGNSRYTLNNVLDEIKKLSRDVSSESLNIDQLKETIFMLQTQVRASIVTGKGINKQHSSRRKIHQVLIAFLIIIVVITSILIMVFIDSPRLTYILYMQGGIIGIILIINIIQIIRSLIK